MKFEWDETKNRRNARKHLIAFDEAVTIFQGEILTDIDESRDYSETRFRSLGKLKLIEGKTIILVVHTQRGERTRIISARRANRRERRKYDEHVRQ